MRVKKPLHGGIVTDHDGGNNYGKLLRVAMIIR